MLPFDLTFEDFLTLSQKPCHYCGTPPSNRWGKAGTHASFVYSGLDRIDSSKGYSIGNCVPCCKDCNSAKGTKTIEEFKKWLERIYAKQLPRN